MNDPDQDRPQRTDESDAGTTDPQPFVAKWVGDASPREPAAVTEQDATIRVGSPFRVDPPRVAQAANEQAVVEAVYADYGPFLYTAMGASVSAVMILLFAAAGSLWFPAGGAVVAILGTVLSIIGLFGVRRFRWAAIGCLPLHIGLFFFSYAKSLS